MVIIDFKEVCTEADRLASKYNKKIAVVRELLGYSIVALQFAMDNSPRLKVVYLTDGNEKQPSTEGAN